MKGIDQRKIIVFDMSLRCLEYTFVQMQAAAYEGLM